MKWIYLGQISPFKYKAQYFMAREEEPFIALLNRTIRSRWLSMVKVVARFVSIMTIVMLLPPSFMAVGLVALGMWDQGLVACH